MTHSYGNGANRRQDRWQPILYWCSNQILQLWHSKTIRYVAVSCILGFSLARFGHSVALAAFASSYFVTPQKGGIRSFGTTAQQEHELADPSITVGGSLFQTAANSGPELNASAESPMKPFKLTGTLEGNPEFARALIEVQGEGIREYCSIAARTDCPHAVQNAKILSIAKEHIWVKIGGVRAKLSLGQSSSDLKLGSPEAVGIHAANERNSSAGGEIFTKVISRENVLKILGGEARMFEGQFGPHVVNGKIEGYKIARVSDDHIFAKLGARNGDIIRRVNGYGLNDLERLMDLYKALKTMSEAKIELERDGKPVTYIFQIRN